MDYEQALAYIHNVKWQGVKPGLERTQALLAALGNPEKSLNFVHIAGTNGKGSTASYIAAVLQKAGYRTGLYISPFILRFNERMQVDSEHITDDELVRLTQEIRPIADAMEEAPTEFELITALAMKHFKHKGCDVVVLEVGMGGELDSTNVIETPDVAVITAIGFDHVAELGPTLVDIAGAKAGIIKSGGDVVIYGGEPEVESVLESKCAAVGAVLHRADYSRISNERFSLGGIEMQFAPYGSLAIPLLGVYQPKNAATAITALEVLRGKGYKIGDGDIVGGIAQVRWPGRFEVLGRDPVFILDGSHNPQGVEATAASLRRYFTDSKITFVVGVMADKDVDSMIRHIAPLASSLIAVKPDYYRAMAAAELAEKLSRYGVAVYTGETMESGVAQAISIAGPAGIVCAIGSLYFSANIRDAYLGATRQ